jgi:hypothetical protein
MQLALRVCNSCATCILTQFYSAGWFHVGGGGWQRGKRFLLKAEVEVEFPPIINILSGT